MNPKQFLVIGGAVLLLVGVLGYMGVIGSTPEESIFGSTWWFDNAENLAHTVLGLVALIMAFVLPASLQKPLVMVLGIIGVLVGLYSAVVSTAFLGANLENPADTFLHLLVGAWALWASMKKQEVQYGAQM